MCTGASATAQPRCSGLNTRCVRCSTLVESGATQREKFSGRTNRVRTRQTKCTDDVRVLRQPRCWGRRRSSHRHGVLSGRQTYLVYRMCVYAAPVLSQMKLDATHKFYFPPLCHGTWPGCAAGREHRGTWTSSPDKLAVNLFMVGGSQLFTVHFSCAAEPQPFELP